MQIKITVCYYDYLDKNTETYSIYIKYTNYHPPYAFVL